MSYLEEIEDIRLPPKWIELNITKRECCTFIKAADDETMCQCGRKKQDHAEFAQMMPHHGLSWNPTDNSRPFPTDAFGTVVFEGEHHPNKAHFVRLSYDTNPEMAIQLMTLVWGLPLPQLLITIQGSNTNFDLSPRIIKILQVGLMKAARSCNAWIFTTGLNDGITKHIGAALNYERQSATTRKGSGGSVVAVGIAPWGLVEHRDELLIQNTDKIYNPLERTHSKFKVLNPKHNNFLLVDNGSVGKIGGETYFRRRLEKRISHLPTGPNRGCDIPVVCIVIEGGLFTLRSIGDYLHDDPPTPVVIVAGTGRTADLVAWVVKKAQQLPPGEEITSLGDDISTALMKVYHVNETQCGVLFAELRRIMKKKHLITVYNVHTTNEDFDRFILGAIFRSQHWSPLQQLCLALVWDRVDLAESEVFVYGREWSSEHLESAMMEALICNRLEFVSLLLERGVNMQKFLTVTRLEELYNIDETSVLKYMVTEMAKVKSRKGGLGKYGGVKLTLHDVGVAISHMMGHIYKSNYIHMVPADKTSSQLGARSADNESPIRDARFVHPFDDMFLWAVLTKRQSLALLLWRHGQGALVKALVAIKLNKYMSESLMDHSNSIAVDFQIYAAEWESLSYDLVDCCFKQDQKISRQLLTMELGRWSKMTNLQIAVIANHRMLLGHPCCQMLLADLWMGALNIKSYPNIKVVVGIFCPILIFFLEYKSTEELKLLPHQEKPTSRSRNFLNDSDSLVTINAKSLGESLTGNVLARENAHRHFHDPDPVTSVENDDVKMSQHPDRKFDDREDDTFFAAAIADAKSMDSTSSGGSPKRVTVEIQTDGVTSVTNHASFTSDDSLMKYRRGYDEHKSYLTTKHYLPAWKKFYEFQKAPITNFYRHAIAYLVFVVLLAYLILVPQDPEVMGWVEIYVIAYLGTMGVEVIREFLTIDAMNCAQKFVEFRSHVWPIADFFFILVFMTGVGLRCTEYFEYGVLIYRVSSIYWNLRLYKYMGVHRFLGPKIVMMFKMLKHMAYFALIILVIIIAFGIARESIRFPDTYPTWRTIGEAFLEPYVMMFGEVDTDSLSPHCGNDIDSCPVGFWIIPLTWVVYMMVANILIVNVLIAVFNGVYSEIDAMALEIWLFQRFNFVMEVEGKSLVPPPLMIICHIYEIIVWLYNKTKLCLCEQKLEIEMDEEEGPRIIMGNDHRLKTYLTLAESNLVFDFEEDNVAQMTSRNISSVTEDGRYLPVASSTIDPFLKAEVFKDRQIQQMKINFRDFSSELESHREKLDRLLTYWEVTLEHEREEGSATSSRTMISRSRDDFSLANKSR